MQQDRRTEPKPRVRPKNSDVEYASNRRPARTAGAPKPAVDIYRPYTAKSQPRATSAAKPRQAERPGKNRDAEYLYPDDAYYKKPPAQRTRPASGKKKPQGSRRNQKKKRRDKASNTVLYTGIAVVMALLVSFLLHTFVFEVIRVSSDAMYSVLDEGDWVVVTKFDYWTSAPERGDIVAVNVSGKTEGVILRRVVGLPGESVAIDGNGDTLINGDPLGERYVTLKNYDEYPEVVLPGGRYFVMSDNRTVKLDSRDADIDVVSKRNIVGKARVILWPLNRSGTL